MTGAYRSGSEYPWVTRMFLRDLAFLQRLYGRSDSPSLWMYSVISVAVTLGSVLLLIASVAVWQFGEALPLELNPATARREVFLFEFVALYSAAGLAVEYFVRPLRYDSFAANPFRTRSDTVKWWVTTLVTAASAGGGVFILVMAGEHATRLG